MQPKSLFAYMKAEFGFTTKPLSMFKPVNTEFGLELKPK